MLKLSYRPKFLQCYRAAISAAARVIAAGKLTLQGY
jgi:hypothetical protein